MAEVKEGINQQEPLQPTYWKSLRQLYNNPEFIEATHNEFKEGVKDEFEISKLPGLSRRKFLALLGASAALAGAGCSDYRDKGEIVPYNKLPEGVLPGKPDFYATTLNCKCGGGVLVKTREGRPIKIDGNPDHPVSRGKVCAKCHANILGLYDPERISSPLKKSGNGFESIFWEKADREIRAEFSAVNKKEIAVITDPVYSPTSLKALEDFANRYPSVKIYSYELIGESVRNSAWRKSYGSDTAPLIKWDEAKVILSLEGDFLGTEGNQVENSRLFVRRRDVKDTENFSRLYVVEGNMSLTGMNADYRMRLRPDAQFEFVMGLINELGGSIGNYSLSSIIQKYSLPEEKVKYLVDDLSSSRGSSIVYAGNSLPEKTHIAVNYLNELLGNRNLYKNELTAPLMPLSAPDDLKALTASMRNGNVAIVIHFDSNPVYHFPEDIGYADALKKVKTIITLTEQESESSNLSHYVLPINHALESWGDSKTRTGFYSLQQPVVSPVLDSRQKEAVLLNWVENENFEFKENIYHEYLKKNWQENIYPSVNSKLPFDTFWLGSLHNGVVITNENAPSAGAFNTAVLSELNFADDVTGFAVILKENHFIGDGRFSNNGWLQELPHPVTKITWDNYAAVSHSTAEELGVKNNDMINIETDNKKLSIPVFIQPGSADNTLTIELGYGRTHSGTVGKDNGFNANVLISSSASSPFLLRAKVNKGEGSYNLVTAQEHYSFDNELTKDAADRRGIIREGTVSEYINNPGFLHEGKGHELHTMYPEYVYTGVKWGMAIDLNKCTGCGECVVACVSENNIPVVGKDQVEMGREMHWIRIDRYYSGDIDEPNVSNQVMLCQHCDNAPCENVCPVVATTHSPDGLNQMIYNRCVGTRYCSNNCPYKVRRFNFYNFRDHFDNGYQLDDLFSMVYNPEVTVRSRGVMEKCTFCIQRIMHSREDAIRENRELRGSDVTTACQDACITNAISFGDVNDRESEVSRFREHNLSYHVLEELNVRPNVTYLAKLRNTRKERV